jgi:hypothetical protein
MPRGVIPVCRQTRVRIDFERLGSGKLEATARDGRLEKTRAFRMTSSETI